MELYELLRGSHGRFEEGKLVVYKKGDHIPLTSEDAAKFGDRVRPAYLGEPERPELDLSNWKAVVEALPGLSLEEVVEVQEAESERKKPRKSVLDAIERRLDELGE